MKRALLWFLLGLVAVGLIGPVWAQGAPDVTLDVLNAVTPGTNVAVVVQGDFVLVEFTVSPLVDSSPDDLIQLRRLDDGSLVTQQVRGDSLTGTVSLSTAPSNALGDLQAVYVLPTTGAVLATAPETVRVVPSGEGGPTTVTVPSALAPTIQAGIDAVADGGTIQVKPGVYQETLSIVGKQVNLIGGGCRGPKCTQIVGPVPQTIVPFSQAGGLVNYGPGGGGLLKDLALLGGDAGIRGFSSAGAVPAAVQVDDVVVHGAGRGIAGDFSDITVKDTEISGTVSHGIVLLYCEEMQLLNGLVSDTGGVALLILNLVNPSGVINIVDTHIFFFSEGGIVVVGGAKPVFITDCGVGLGGEWGILLIYASLAYVQGTNVTSIVRADDRGHGLAVGYSDFVFVGDCSVTQCEYAGTIFHSSGGLILGMDSGIDNRIGFSVLGEPKPDYSDPDNVFSGWEGDIITDGPLGVPEPPPLPAEP